MTSLFYFFLVCYKWNKSKSSIFGMIPLTNHHASHTSFLPTNSRCLPNPVCAPPSSQIGRSPMYLAHLDPLFPSTSNWLRKTYSGWFGKYFFEFHILLYPMTFHCLQVISRIIYPIISNEFNESIQLQPPIIRFSTVF